METGRGAESFEEEWTRAEFVRRVGGGAALVLGGSALLRVADAAAASAVNRDGVQHFRSRPDLKPPAFKVLHRGKHGSGHIFIAPSSGPGDTGALILDEAGDMVWFRKTKPATAMNFRPQTYRGKPVLTWWEGKSTAGLGIGTHVIADDTYREIAHFPAGRGRQSDLHEFVITPQNTVIISSYDVRYRDTTKWGGGKKGEVVGGVVQELELPSGRVLFEWKSLDHVPLAESYQVVGENFFDYFHINSIELAPDGDFVVSARHTWAVYKISRRTGKIVWRLGGRKSNFAMGPGTGFAWQHDARLHDDGRLISIFDNGAAPQVQPQSRALLIALDRRHRKATLVKKFTHKPGRLVSKFMGNAQLLGNGNVVVGWGGEPFVTEFAPDGTIVFDGKLPTGGQNYRAFRFRWVGRPGRHPQVAVRPGRLLYVSWNGATEIASWRLESGRLKTGLTHVHTFPKQGFETTLTVPRGDHLARAVALDAHGKPLGHTPSVRL